MKKLSEIEKNIVLCGFMGCGKTTIGRRLSAETDLDFIDIDKYIENKKGICISSIFEIYGENYFRNLETEACMELSKCKGKIIATGGGTLINSENVEILKYTGIIIFLDISLPEASKRLSFSVKRPLLDREDRHEYIEKLYYERKPLYENAADVAINADIPSILICEKIVRYLSSKLYLA